MQADPPQHFSPLTQENPGPTKKGTSQKGMYVNIKSYNMRNTGLDLPTSVTQTELCTAFPGGQTHVPDTQNDPPVQTS